MNERIKEITVQALENSLFEPIDPTVTVGEGENKVTIPLVFAEKFAQLIVKECANRASWAQDTGEKDIGGEVLKHFGVEE